MPGRLAHGLALQQDGVCRPTGSWLPVLKQKGGMLTCGVRNSVPAAAQTSLWKGSSEDDQAEILISVDGGDWQLVRAYRGKVAVIGPQPIDLTPFTSGAESFKLGFRHSNDGSGKWSWAIDSIHVFGTPLITMSSSPL